MCDNFSVTRDQVTRLKFVWHLPPRHDRRYRFKPAREVPPDAAEEAASQASLNLAPQIAARVTCVQITWDDRTRADRQVVKPQAFSVRVIDVPAEAAGLLEEFEGDA